jgi:hypothetical protein
LLFFILRESVKKSIFCVELVLLFILILIDLLLLGSFLFAGFNARCGRVAAPMNNDVSGDKLTIPGGAFPCRASRGKYMKDI